jgi:hypothetical protein
LSKELKDRKIRRSNSPVAAPCFFLTSFIGISITPEGISIEKEKVRAVAEWPTPTTVKQLQSFLGFANFLRRWVSNFSSLAKLLTTLT